MQMSMNSEIFPEKAKILSPRLEQREKQKTRHIFS